ncbi:MAG: low temperature requirement protein A [Anaerolineae bacterium]|nr:low temperature requirement protein A [Anaerolineae bacterium]
MSENQTRSRWIAPLTPRSPDEEHRSATPLELFFDLVFVVAIAQAANALHHGIAEGHGVESVVSYVVVFIVIWWAWMSFSWFANSYDNGDVPYRLVVFVQMTGALIMAAGVESLFNNRDFTVTVLGYVVMRVAHVTQYLRVIRSDREHRPAAIRYALALSLTQLGWVLFLLVPAQWKLPLFAAGITIELLIPAWAERGLPIPWHSDHIRERYGLFTIIVLGEVVLSTSLAIQVVRDQGLLNSAMFPTLIGGLLIVYSIWWLYFYQPADFLTNSLLQTYVWAYGHLLIYGATAAIGAGLAVMIDVVIHHAEISTTAGSMALAMPVAIYVFSLWVLHEHPRAENPIDRLLHPIIVVLILLTAFTDQVVLYTGLLLVFLLAVRLMRHLE